MFIEVQSTYKRGEEPSTVVSPVLRFCTWCATGKPETAFVKRKRNISGWSRWCRSCSEKKRSGMLEKRGKRRSPVDVIKGLCKRYSIT
jgi:hypothetical protein